MTAPDVHRSDELASADGRRVFSLSAGAEYLCRLGADSVTPWTLRRLVTSGALKHLKLGRKYFVTRESLDQLVERLERRAK